MSGEKFSLVDLLVVIFSIVIFGLIVLMSLNFANSMLAIQQNIAPSTIQKHEIKTYFNDTTLCIEIENATYYYEPYGTGSMRPILDKNNMLIIKKYNGEKIKIGDILALDCAEHKNEGICKNDDGKGILHQVIGFCDNGFITKGTNSDLSDDVCWRTKDIKYKVIGVLWT